MEDAISNTNDFARKTQLALLSESPFYLDVENLRVCGSFSLTTTLIKTINTALEMATDSED